MVLAEVAELLRAYPEGWAVIGGMAIKVLLDEWGKSGEYLGTTDVDIALDPRAIPADAYETIHERLATSGYSVRTNVRGEEIPFSYSKTVEVEGQPVTVQLDLMAPVEGAGGHRHHRIQDAAARTAQGVDLVFEDTKVITRRLKFPGGGELEVALRVSWLAGLFATKGASIGPGREKDAYDLYWLLRGFPGGPKAAAQELVRHASSAEMQAAVRNLKRYFESVDALGPRAVAQYEAPAAQDEPVVRRGLQFPMQFPFEFGTTEQDEAVLRRDAYEVMQAVIARVEQVQTG